MQSAPALAIVTAIVLAVPFAASAEDSGRIYVYAQQPTAARSWLPIKCDSVVVAELKRGVFFAIGVAPGRHSLSVERGVPAFVDVQSGEEAFVRLDWNYEVGRPAIPVLAAVHPERAQKEIMNLSYIDAKKVLSLSVPKTDPRKPTQLQWKRRREQ